MRRRALYMFGTSRRAATSASALLACGLLWALVLNLIGPVTGVAQTATPELGKLPIFGYAVVHTYSHDRDAFTQGLQFFDGALYEGTGLNGRSSIRKVKLETGE